jgi:hypothetical protein
LLLEVAVAEALPNFCGVVPASVASAVRREVGRGGQVYHAGRHVGRIGQKRTQESGSNDLQRQTEAVVLAAPFGEQLAIGVVEVEVASELSGCRFAGVAAVAAPLFFGQEIDGHGGAC